jgi:linoleate 9S-lipoxygenase
LQGKIGRPSYLENWITTITPLIAGESAFKVTFDWENEIGVPGAFLIRNNHHSEFYLKTLTLEDVPGQGRVHFVCNSWVYPANKYEKDRVFFSNKVINYMRNYAVIMKFQSFQICYLKPQENK